MSAVRKRPDRQEDLASVRESGWKRGAEAAVSDKAAGRKDLLPVIVRLHWFRYRHTWRPFG